MKSHDRAGARAAFAQARELAPGRHDICAALARVLLADGDLTAAADVFRQALALQPGDAAVRADFGRCLLEMGERDAGEDALRVAANEPLMFSRIIMTLAASSHGRFFMRPSRAEKFLRGRM
jgi:Tfp pilus assembly protein PilF